MIKIENSSLQLKLSSHALFSFPPSLLSQLPGMFSGAARPGEVVFEPAVRAGLEALKAAGRNGRLFLFHTSLPSAPVPGQLKNRLDPKLLGTDKEKVRKPENKIHNNPAAQFALVFSLLSLLVYM